MRLKKASGERYVLMLGAGASMSSGVKRTPDIMEELLAQYGQDLNGPDRLEDRFDRLWKRTPDATRRAFLQPYLDHPPSPGYAKLAALVDAGYFDVILTFNFDDLVETGLKQLGFTDFNRIVRGETIDDEMQKLVDAQQPQFKIVKLHGSLESSDHFLFDANEMNEYPKPIADLVTKVTARDLIVCGYGFADVCVLRAFSTRGGSVVCVNPSGVPRGLRGFLKDRRSDELAVDVKFDDFFDDLHRELLVAPPPSAAPKRNPFKFLQSYEASDAESFKGRTDEITQFQANLAKTPQVIIVVGPAKAGKTSLVRAGIIPSVDATTHAPVYVRCQPELEKTIRAELWPDRPDVASPGLAGVFQQLATEAAGKRVVLFLDQFERSTARFDLATRVGRDELAALCKGVLSAPVALTLVPVIVDDNQLLTTLVQGCSMAGVAFQIVQCAAFERTEVMKIIQTLAQTAEIEFDQRIIDEMSLSYEQTKTASPEQRLTLAHVQAVFHILTATGTLDYDRYRRAFDNNLNALHQAINVCDIIGFVEDLSWPNDVWFRNMISVALRESKERIAEFIKMHYEELVPQPAKAPVLRPPWSVPQPSDARTAAGTA
jgi:hypothetical protein